MTRKKAKRSRRKKGPNKRKNQPNNGTATDAMADVITTKSAPIIHHYSGPLKASSQASYISLSRVNWINNMAVSLAEGGTKNRYIIMNELYAKDINIQDLQCHGSFTDQLTTYRMTLPSNELCTKDFEYLCPHVMNLSYKALPVPKSYEPLSPSKKDQEKKPSTFTTHVQYKQTLLEVCSELPHELLNLIVLDMIGYCALDESIYPKKE